MSQVTDLPQTSFFIGLYLFPSVFTALWLLYTSRHNVNNHQWEIWPLSCLESAQLFTRQTPEWALWCKDIPYMLLGRLES